VASSTPSARPPNGSRQAWTRRPRSTAARSPANGCWWCWTTPATPNTPAPAPALAVARAATHPGFPLAAGAAELSAAGGLLDTLAADDPATDVRAVFSWSYQALAAPAARLFRLLGLHPGPDTCAPAAASLAGQPLPDVRRTLAELARANLITEYAPGRYGFHDLLRTHAADLTHGIDTSSAASRSADCSTTTCTPPTPPTGSCVRHVTRSPSRSPRPRPAPARNTMPASSRPWLG
jgi:hypothetical protein